MKSIWAIQRLRGFWQAFALRQHKRNRIRSRIRTVDYIFAIRSRGYCAWLCGRPALGFGVTPVWGAYPRVTSPDPTALLGVLSTFRLIAWYGSRYPDTRFKPVSSWCVPRRSIFIKIHTYDLRIRTLSPNSLESIGIPITRPTPPGRYLSQMQSS